MRIHLPISDKGRKIRIKPYCPVLFLAGPIRNAPKWQEEAIENLLWLTKSRDKTLDIFVASPTRTLSPDLLSICEKDDDSYEEFTRQRAWEQYYLECASIYGCIIFWLPKEAEPKEVEDKVYAHITMMELGEWIVRKRDGMNIVVGTDGEFPEWSTIKYEIETNTNIPICYSLEDTLNTALKLMKI